MATKKDRRHSGYITPRATISRKEQIENDLFIDDFYDEWTNYRDGMREWFRDFKKIKTLDIRCRKFNSCLFEKRMQMNKKQKRLLRIRKARKFQRNYFIEPLIIEVCHGLSGKSSLR